MSHHYRVTEDNSRASARLTVSQAAKLTEVSGSQYSGGSTYRDDPHILQTPEICKLLGRLARLD